MISNQAEKLLLSRYAHNGESAEDVYKRVAKALAIRDVRFEQQLLELMTSGTFLPNSPAIRNAGKKKGMLSACFVIPIEDSIASIFDTVRNMAVIFQRGGGVGINFSSLRPKGAPLSGGGTSSGAISFMGIFNAITETVKQGGFRRGALMGILNHTHPEIANFCRSKLKGDLTNFNISVMVTDEFMMKATQYKHNGMVLNDGKYDLLYKDAKYGEARAKDILDLIALGAWVAGDPGILFYDRINKDNKYYPNLKITGTNPCAEEPLPDFGACCLGSINLTKFVEGDKFNFGRFYDVCKLGTRALLNINIINSYPIPQITKVMGDLNSVGLGVMGLADTLIMLGIYYDSEEAINFIQELSQPYVHATDEVATDSFYKRSIAPTGTLSILADCSSGIEPVFDRSFERHLTVGVVEETRDIYDSKYVRTAREISPDWHLKIQAEFQRFVDSGVSKTINAPADISVEEIKNIYIKAWEYGVKGITIFREESKEGVWIPKPRVKCSDEACHL